MTNATPIAFLVDSNGVPLRQGVVVDAATGAPTIVTINPSTGLPVLTVVGSGGGGSGNVTNVGTFASSGALQTAFPAAANLGAFGNVGASAPYVVYQSNGSAWAPVGTGSIANVGTYASGAALQTAFPAASNKGSFAYVGSSSPYVLYTSDGSSWNASSGGISTIASASDYNSAVVAPIAANTAAIALKISNAIPFSATTGVATAPAPTGTFTPTSGTAPPAGFNVVTCTSNAGALPTAVDSITSMALNDSLVYSPALGVWTLNKAKLALADLSDGAAQQTAISAAVTTSMLNAAVAGLSTPLMVCNVNIGRAPDGMIGANGALTIGTSVGGGSLTFGATTAGSTTVNASLAAFASTDVNRFITVGGVVCTITAYTSTTVVTVTIPTGGISSATWANGTWALGTGMKNLSSGTYSSGVWLYFPANVINGSNAAGFYWVVMGSSFTPGQVTGTIYQNNYIPGHNGSGDANGWRIPASPTPFSGTTGSAYAAGTSAITTHSQVVPAIGPYGEITSTISHANSNSAGTKTVSQTLNGLSMGYFYAATTQVNNSDSSTITAKGNGQVQAFNSGGATTHSSTTVLNRTSFDTTVAQTLQTQVTCAVATDWAVIETHKVTMIYNA